MPLPEPVFVRDGHSYARGDHWEEYRHGSPWSRGASPFRVTTDELLKRAGLELHWWMSEGSPLMPPRRSVSAFARWIYDLYTSFVSQEQLRWGETIEKAVDTQELRRKLEVYLRTDWRLLYRDPLDGSTEPLTISKLQIAGHPMMGRPDLVFQHADSKELIIVERKASQAAMPSDTWPNARAQLWCYAQADLFIHAPRITLVVEAWRDNRDGIVYSNGVVTWSSAELEFARESAALFSIYKRYFE